VPFVCVPPDTFASLFPRGTAETTAADVVRDAFAMSAFVDISCALALPFTFFTYPKVCGTPFTRDEEDALCPFFKCWRDGDLSCQKKNLKKIFNG
jgi:hypothetical protein